MVGSMAITEYIGVPIICLTRVMDLVVRTGDPSGFSTHWMLAPYTGFLNK